MCVLQPLGEWFLWLPQSPVACTCPTCPWNSSETSEINKFPIVQLLFYRWMDAAYGLCHKMQDKKRDGAADYEYIFCIYSHWFGTVVKTLKQFHPACCCCCYWLLELPLREASTESIPPWHEATHVNLYACCTYVQYMRAQEWNRGKDRGILQFKAVT